MNLGAEVEEAYLQLSQPTQSAEQVVLVKKCIELFLITFKYHLYDETRKLLHPQYKQHDPLVGDGAESAIEFDKFVTKEAERLGGGQRVLGTLNFKRILVDHDMAVMHMHVIRWEGDRGLAIADFFRFDDEGKFIEHWDVIQEVPEKSMNQNGMF